MPREALACPGLQPRHLLVLNDPGAQTSRRTVADVWKLLPWNKDKPMPRSRLSALPKFLRSRNRSVVSRRKSRRSQRTRPPRLESLESRTVLSTFTVLNTDDSGPGSLRQAIEDANTEPGADIILVRQGVSGTIELTSTLEVTDDVRIRGPGADELEVSGMNAHRVFAVLPPSAEDPAPTVTISELTVSDGLATDAPGYEDPGSPFAGLFGWGGGLYNLGGTVHLDRVHMVDNQAVGFLTAGGAGTADSVDGGAGIGGGIFNEGDLTLDLTFIYLNEADFGDDFWQVP